jgi:hypothetical protein
VWVVGPPPPPPVLPPPLVCVVGPPPPPEPELVLPLVPLETGTPEPELVLEVDPLVPVVTGVAVAVLPATVPLEAVLTGGAEEGGGAAAAGVAAAAAAPAPFGGPNAAIGCFGFTCLVWWITLVWTLGFRSAAVVVVPCPPFVLAA